MVERRREEEDHVSATELPAVESVDSVETVERFAITGWSARAVAIVAFTFGAFQFYAAGARPILGVVMYSIHLGFALALVFALYPLRRSAVRRSIPAADLVPIALGVIAVAYSALNAREILSFTYRESNTEVILGTILVVLVIEAARRSMGIIFPMLVILSLLYALFGFVVPGQFGHQGFSWPTIVRILYFSPQGFWGIMLQISATLLAIFLIFGAVLLKSGGGAAFMDIAFLASGRTRGGPAKVAAIASGLFGTVSGSAVANVATTGTFTIPLMKRAGFSPEFAGAAEAAASTGGILMPPIMGAGAFLIAEFLGIPYTQVAAAALLPAVLYYTGLLFAIHLQAVKLNIPTLPASEQQSILGRLSIQRAFLPVVPLGILIFLFMSGYTPQLGAYWATLASIALSVFIVGGGWGIERLKRFALVPLQGLEAAGKAIAEVAVLLAAAQIVVSMLALTGLAVKFSDLLVSVGQENLAATLVLGMIVVIILGMGVPPTAVYVLGGSILAPALIQLGIEPLPAHLFVFYFSCIGAITPPVCAAVFVASSIAQSDWWRTGWTAVRLGINGFIVPFMFVYNSTLLLQGTPLQVAMTVIPAFLGVFLLATSAIGYFAGRLNAFQRALMGIGGLMLVQPGLVTDVAGLLLAVGMYTFQRMRATRGDVAQAKK